jgi:hypothetical protein
LVWAGGASRLVSDYLGDGDVGDVGGSRVQLWLHGSRLPPRGRPGVGVGVGGSRRGALARQWGVRCAVALSLYSEAIRLASFNGFAELDTPIALVAGRRLLAEQQNLPTKPQMKENAEPAEQQSRVQRRRPPDAQLVRVPWGALLVGPEGERAGPPGDASAQGGRQQPGSATRALQGILTRVIQNLRHLRSCR